MILVTILENVFALNRDHGICKKAETLVCFEKKKRDLDPEKVVSFPITYPLYFMTLK